MTDTVEAVVYDWTFPAYRLDAFKARVAAANRKLEGQAEFVMAYVELMKMVTPKGGVPVAVPYVTATLDGPLRLSIGDYTFVASLVAEEMGVTVHTAPGQSLDGWKRPAVDDVHCDHCNLDRRRTRLYIVRNNEDGELLQLGHSCIAKFLGIEPKGLWALTFDDDLSEFVAEDTGEGGGGFSQRDYSALVADVIGMAFAMSDEGRSYISVAAADGRDGLHPTGSQVREALFSRTPCPNGRWATPEAIAAWEAFMAKRAKGFEYGKDAALIADIKAVAETLTAGTDYADNMAILVAGEYVSDRNVGILASLVSIYAREKELAVERARAKPPADEWLGAVGDKLKDIVITLKTVRFGESQYGSTTFMVGRDDDEHVIVWAASKHVAVESGDRLFIKSASIKATDEYKSTKQTVLTRARINEELTWPSA